MRPRTSRRCHRCPTPASSSSASRSSRILGTRVSQQISAAIAGTEVRGRRAGPSTGVRPGRRPTLQGEVMTCTADTEASVASRAVAEQVAQDPSRDRTPASAARRRVAPARAAAAGADLHDRRHPDPVPVHAVLLDAVVEPGAPRVAAVRRAEQLHRRRQGQPRSGRWRSTPSS